MFWYGCYMLLVWMEYSVFYFLDYWSGFLSRRRRKGWRGWRRRKYVFCCEFDSARALIDLFSKPYIIMISGLYSHPPFYFKNSPILPSIHFASTSLIPPPAACPHTLSITAKCPCPNNPTSTSLSSTAKY